MTEVMNYNLFHFNMFTNMVPL